MLVTLPKKMSQIHGHQPQIPVKMLYPALWIKDEVTQQNQKLADHFSQF